MTLKEVFKKWCETRGLEPKMTVYAGGSTATLKEGQARLLRYVDRSAARKHRGAQRYVVQAMKAGEPWYPFGTVPWSIDELRVWAWAEVMKIELWGQS